MFFWDKKEVYIGHALDKLAKIREILSVNGIKYTFSVTARLGAGATRGRIGSFGQKPELDKLYTVFVKSKDFEQAKYLIDKEFHGR